ncbi:MAG: hypothetical protein O2816_08070 [Planctomycetota bacterium]|nr:hypothetical protein [Planctomycetota bacterium]
MLLIWILIGLFALVVVLPYILGMLAGDDYHGRIRVALPAPPEDIWRVLRDCQRHPVSGAMAQSVTLLEESGAWVEDLGRTQLRVTTEIAEEPTHMILQIRDQVVPMTARWEIHLQPGEEVGETECRIHNRTTIRSGTWHSPVFRLIMKVTNAADKVLREYLRGVAGDLGVTARVMDPGSS